VASRFYVPRYARAQSDEPAMERVNTSSYHVRVTLLGV
jgi:hypothetical protein